MTRLLLALSLIAVATHAHGVDIGQHAPAFQLSDLDGQPISLTQHEGKVRLVNFWASWCEPCRHEVPALNQLRAEYEAQGFEIIGISVDKEIENAKAFLDKIPANYPVAIDVDFNTAKDYNAQAMPMSYIVDRDGKVQAVFTGFSQKNYLQLRPRWRPL